MATSSDIRYCPLGFRSASTGTRRPMRVKSSSVSSTPAACAIASRCKHGVGRAAERDDDGDRHSRTRHASVSSRDADRARSTSRPRRRRAGNRRAWRPRPLPARSCWAGSCPAPRLRRPWCSRCTCRRRSPAPGIARALHLPQSRVIEAPARVLRPRPRTRTRCRAGPVPDGWCRRRRTPKADSAAPCPSRSPACSCRSRRWRRSRRSPRAPTTVSMESAMISRDTSE